MRRSVELRVGAELARQVARSRGLDLDHLGPEHGQLIAAERAGEHVGEVEDPDTLEKLRHDRRL